MGLVTQADKMLIGGKLVESESDNWDASINPANEEVIGRSLVRAREQPALELPHYLDSLRWRHRGPFGPSVRQAMRIAQEVFGPVLSVSKWNKVHEAIEIANSTEYGLTCSISTRDLDAALSTARLVRSGYQWINGYSAHSSACRSAGTRTPASVARGF